jgi:hypothetical protein
MEGEKHVNGQPLLIGIYECEKKCGESSKEHLVKWTVGAVL